VGIIKIKMPAMMAAIGVLGGCESHFPISGEGCRVA
jgi:hypothetical protein